MLFRSQHETRLRVTTWGLRFQLNGIAEGQKGGRDQLLKLRPLYWSRTSINVATNHLGRDLNSEHVKVENLN